MVNEEKVKLIYDIVICLLYAECRAIVVEIE